MPRSEYLHNMGKRDTSRESSRKLQIAVDRRREPREPATGSVTVRLGGKREIEGEMVDVSPSGLRIRYKGEPLPIGSEVDITYPWGRVSASIVWVALAGPWVDVGFLISR